MSEKHRMRGQSLLEFALVLPLILLMFLLFIDLGRIIYFHSTLYNAVREGARYAIVTQFPSSTQRATDIRQRVVDYSVALPINPGNVSIWCDRDPLSTTENPCEDYITVSAQTQVQPMTVFLAWIIGSGNTYNITAESTMQMTPFGAYSD